MLSALKFGNRRGSVRWLGHALALRFDQNDFDAVTWVPSSRSGQTERGYDTGKLLARQLGHALGLPAYRLLVRTGGERQTHRSVRQRHVGPQLEATSRAFQTDRVLLIDDVCTTGASIAASASLLRSCGVSYIEAAVAARTPLDDAKRAS